MKFLLFLLLLVGQAFAADPCATAGQCAPQLPEMRSEPNDLTRVVQFFPKQHPGGRYARKMEREVVVGSGYVLKFKAYNITQGGTEQPLKEGRNALLVDDAEHAVIQVPAGVKVAQFVVNEADLKPGWRRVRVQEPDGKLSPTWFVHVGTQIVDRVVPLATSVFDWTHGAKDPTHRWTWIPADAKPAPYPVKVRDWVPFNTALTGKDLHLSVLIPDTGWRLIDTSSVPWSTFGAQSYYWSDFIRKMSVLPLLDGPAGYATFPMPTHIEIGVSTLTTDPTSKKVGAIYGLNPWALARVNEDGAKKTLVGWYGWPGDMRLAGDWSAIPSERHGLHEAWSFRFWPYTLESDLSAPLVNGRPPHKRNPVGFITDTQNNRVLRVEFDRLSHDTPAKVTEFITNIHDPWGMVIWRDELIVAERLAHRIAAYDVRTGAFKRVVLTCDGTNYAQNRDRSPVVLPSPAAEAEALAKRRAAPCVAPEGLDLDGDDLLIASQAQAQIRRLGLVAGNLRVQGNVPIDAKSNFMTVAASDGFGPPGTAFAATWTGTQFGFPVAILPTGQRWVYMQNAEGAPSSGRGPLWASRSYAAAVGVKAGRLVFGSSEFGLFQIGKAAASDPVIDVKKYKAGRLELDPLLFGEGGFSPYGYIPPRSANADYYLKVHGL